MSSFLDQGYTALLTREPGAAPLGIPTEIADDGRPRLVLTTSPTQPTTLDLSPLNANEVTNMLPPKSVTIDKLLINKIGINDYIASNDYEAEVSGWRIFGNGDAEFNNGVFRGELQADTGEIGGWIIEPNKLYYGGSEDASIQTSEFVGSGSNGVIMDQDGIRGYSAALGQVFDLPSDGSAPTFASGIITDTIYEINTNAVLRTSETVGDGSSDSFGVLINNTGVYGCGPDQLLSGANFKLNALTGEAYFSGTVNVSDIVSSTITGATIDGSIITGGTIRTAATGQRTIITSEGIALMTGAVTGTYGSFKYGSGTKYGSGVLAYINNTDLSVPFYISGEQTVADFHFYNRGGDPTGPAEIGDVAVVGGTLKVCTVAGTPGTWVIVGTQT
jgi:hypothetical protein